MTKAQVIGFEMRGDGVADSFTIRVTRVDVRLGLAERPRHEDVPEDVRQALRIWLAGNGWSS